MDPELHRCEPPYVALHRRLLEQADALASSGQVRDAAALRTVVESWWRDQEEWRSAVFGTLRLHHEINNALVGVRGNAQLLMMGPAAELPGVRDRLEVVLRETSRIQEAAGRIRELKSALEGTAPADRAA